MRRGSDLEYDRSPMLGTNVLIVGESHYWYDDCVDSEVLTMRVCLDFIDPARSPYAPFQLPITAAVTGNREPAECRALWRSAAFYNYVRYLMPDPGTGPTEEQLNERAAFDAFREVLSRVKPACVLLFSKRVYDYLPSYDEPGADAAAYIGRGQFPAERGRKGEPEPGWFKTGDGDGDLALLPMNHPRNWNPTGKSAAYWHPFIQRTLEYVKARSRGAGA